MKYPLIKHVTWCGENKVRLIFSTDSVRDALLPVRSAKKVRITGCGLLLDLGDGVEWSALYAYANSKAVRSGRSAWLHAHPEYKRIVQVPC